MKALLETIFKVPTPQLVDTISKLQPTRKPNQAVILAAGDDGQSAQFPKAVILHGCTYKLDAAHLLTAAGEYLLRELKAVRLNDSSAENIEVYCVRTPLIRYPDLMYLEGIDLAQSGRSTLSAYSHSIYGRSDLGANEKRLRGLIDALKLHQIEEKFA